MTDLAPVRVLAFDTKTGELVARLPYSTAKFTETINEPGSLSVEVPMSAEALTLNLRERLGPWRTSLAMVRDWQVLAAGPITSRTYKPGESLSFTCGGGWTLMEKRLVLDPKLLTDWENATVLIDDDHPASNQKWVLIFEGTLRDIAARLVRTANNWDALPLDIPHLEGGKERRDYYAPDYVTVAQALKDIAATEGGPELAFRPYLTKAMGLRWTFSGGAPELVANSWRWNAAVPGQRVMLDSIDEDGADLAGHLYSSGGKRDDKVLVARVRRNELMDARGYPLLMEKTTVNDAESNVKVLLADLGDAIDVATGPQESFELKVGAEYQVRAGDHVRLTIADPYLRETTLSLKVTQVSGDAGEWFTVNARHQI